MCRFADAKDPASMRPAANSAESTPDSGPGQGACQWEPAGQLSEPRSSTTTSTAPKMPPSQTVQ